MKKEFTSTKGKFVYNLITKLCSSKIIDYLTNEDKSNSTEKCNLSSCKIKSYKFLITKFKRGSPVPFVLTKDEGCLFLIGDNEACNFTFSNHVVALIGLNYFCTKDAKQADTPLSILSWKMRFACNKSGGCIQLLLCSFD